MRDLAEQSSSPEEFISKLFDRPKDFVDKAQRARRVMRLAAQDPNRDAVLRVNIGKTSDFITNPRLLKELPEANVIVEDLVINDLMQDGLAYVNTGRDFDDGKVFINVNNIGKIAENPDILENLLAHELTHLKRLHLHREFDHSLPYLRRVHEVSARKAGEFFGRFKNVVDEATKFYNDLQ